MRMVPVVGSAITRIEITYRVRGSRFSWTVSLSTGGPKLQIDAIVAMP